MVTEHGNNTPVRFQKLLKNKNNIDRMTLYIDEKTIKNIGDCDAVIDVRSPREFHEDHIIGSVNLPVLKNNEHEKVGTIYKNISPFEAKKIGARLVSLNIASHLQTFFCDKKKSFKPLFYCARGGQRSNSFATICASIGWKCAVLDGGYKAYRKSVMREIEQFSKACTLIVISGKTGNGKTEILSHISSLGGNILDLEGLASHRGSMLGGFPGTEQPRQKYFETLLMEQIRKLDLSKPVFLEAESNKIGNVNIPAELFKKMHHSGCIVVENSRQNRASFLVARYSNVFEDENVVEKFFEFLDSRHPADVAEKAKCFFSSKDWNALARHLLDYHYDPSYERSMGLKDRKILLHAKCNGDIENTARDLACDIISKYG